MNQTSIRWVFEMCESGLDTSNNRVGWILRSSTRMVWTLVVPEWFGY